MILNTRYLVVLFLALSLVAFGQIDDYNYKRDIKGVSDTWHSLTIPDAIFEKVSPDLSDLRIYGITAKNDTIEAPYLLKINSERIINTDIPFEIINQTKTREGYYFTFKLNSDAIVNHLKLDFNNANFDWKVKLDGSQNQQEWYTVLVDYRILSIKNNNTDYAFTTLSFPDAKYRYFRMLVKSEVKPKLNTATILKREITKGTYIDHEIVKTRINDNKTNKTTIIDFELKSAVSINTITIDVKENFDYYRPVRIEYLADSITTEKGWKYNYRTITSGTLNSLENNDIKFLNTIVKTLRVIIYNYDNQPLTITSVSAKGYRYQLMARFTDENAKYVLAYGKQNAYKPSYDINQFKNTIPETLSSLKLGEEQTIERKEASKTSPLFESEYWLWGIMIVVIVMLGGFTLTMMKKR